MTININELTIAQIKEIASLAACLGGVAPGAAPTASAETGSKANGPFTAALIGKYAICRCYSAGVHAGIVSEIDGDAVVLSDSRRLWSWRAVEGVALSGLACSGIAPGCKVDTLVPTIRLTGVIEIIPTSVAAQNSINAY